MTRFAREGRRSAAPAEAYGLLIAPLRGLRRARSARLMHVRPTRAVLGLLTSGNVMSDS